MSPSRNTGRFLGDLEGNEYSTDGSSYSVEMDTNRDSESLHAASSNAAQQHNGHDEDITAVAPSSTSHDRRPRGVTDRRRTPGVIVPIAKPRRVGRSSGFFRSLSRFLQNGDTNLDAHANIVEPAQQEMSPMRRAFGYLSRVFSGDAPQPRNNAPVTVAENTPREAPEDEEQSAHLSREEERKAISAALERAEVARNEAQAEVNKAARVKLGASSRGQNATPVAHTDGNAILSPMSRGSSALGYGLSNGAFGRSSGIGANTGASKFRSTSDDVRVLSVPRVVDPKPGQRRSILSYRTPRKSLSAIDWYTVGGSSGPDRPASARVVTREATATDERLPTSVPPRRKPYDPLIGLKSFQIPKFQQVKRPSDFASASTARGPPVSDLREHVKSLARRDKEDYKRGGMFGALVPPRSNTPPPFEKKVLKSLAKMRDDFRREKERFEAEKKRRPSFSYYDLPVKRRRFLGEFGQAAHIPEGYHMKPMTQAEYGTDFIPTRIDFPPKKVDPNANYLAYGCGPRTPRKAKSSNGAEDDTRRETGSDAKETLEEARTAGAATSRDDGDEIEPVVKDGAAGNDWSKRWYLERIEITPVTRDDVAKEEEKKNDTKSVPVVDPKSFLKVSNPNDRTTPTSAPTQGPVALTNSNAGPERDTPGQAEVPNMPDSSVVGKSKDSEKTYSSVASPLSQDLKKNIEFSGTHIDRVESSTNFRPPFSFAFPKAEKGGGDVPKVDGTGSAVAVANRSVANKEDAGQQFDGNVEKTYQGGFGFKSSSGHISTGFSSVEPALGQGKLDPSKNEFKNGSNEDVARDEKNEAQKASVPTFVSPVTEPQDSKDIEQSDALGAQFSASANSNVFNSSSSVFSFSSSKASSKPAFSFGSTPVRNPANTQGIETSSGGIFNNAQNAEGGSEEVEVSERVESSKVIEQPEERKEDATVSASKSQVKDSADKKPEEIAAPAVSLTETASVVPSSEAAPVVSPVGSAHVVSPTPFNASYMPTSVPEEGKESAKDSGDDAGSLTKKEEGGINESKEGEDEDSGDVSDPMAAATPPSSKAADSSDEVGKSIFGGAFGDASAPGSSPAFGLASATRAPVSNSGFMFGSSQNVVAKPSDGPFADAQFSAPQNTQSNLSTFVFGSTTNKPAAPPSSLACGSAPASMSTAAPATSEADSRPASISFGSSAPLFGGVTGFNFGETAPAFGTTAPFSASTQSLASTASAFGSTVPAFGSSAPVFSATMQAFGNPEFGATAPSFGTNAPSFGASTRAFDATTPSFGAPSPGFGMSSSGFSSTASAFGSTPAFSPATSAFGSATTSTFGATGPALDARASGFGATAPAFGAFGASGPAFGASGSGFGSTVSAFSSTPAFGTTGGFGVANGEANAFTFNSSANQSSGAFSVGTTGAPQRRRVRVRRTLNQR